MPDATSMGCTVPHRDREDSHYTFRENLEVLRDSFTDPVRNSRVDDERRRVEAEEPPMDTAPRCWACDKPCPSGTRFDVSEWASRTHRHRGGKMTETYCPECFGRWGWGDGLCKPPKRHVIRPWSRAEIAKLRDGCVRGMTNTQLAVELGRSVKSVEIKVSKMRFTAIRKQGAA